MSYLRSNHKQGVSHLAMCCATAALFLTSPLPESVGIQAGNKAQAGPLKVGRLNPTGRAITMPLPLKAEGRSEIGELSVRISANDAISLSRTAFVRLVKRGLRPEVFASLEKLKKGRKFIALKTLQRAGFDVRFDSNKMEVQIYLKPDQRPVGQFSMSGRHSAVSSNLETPEDFSGYINFSASLDYVMDSQEHGLEAPTINMNSVTWLMGVALENEMTLEPDYTGQLGTTRFGDYTFRRQGTRLVYDNQEKAMRFQLGDITPYGAHYQSRNELLGLSIEKSYRKLQPGRSIRPTSRTSFRLERPSTVDIMINGGIVRKLRLRAGDYNLSDLPMRAGANDITLHITDDQGRTRDLSFSTFSGNDMLAPGINEWSLAGGVRSTYTDGELQYDYSDPVVTGYYRQGLSTNLTGDLHAQADSEGGLVGGGLQINSSFGFFSLGSAFSYNKVFGAGVAANASWSMNNVQDFDGKRASYRLSADYISDNFADINTDDPYNQYWLRLNAGYSRQIGYGVSASLSARYAFATDTPDAQGIVNGDSYGLDLSLNKNLLAGLNLGLTVGYTNESYTRTSLADNSEDEVHAAIRLSYQLGARSSVRSSYDTRSDTTSATYTTRSEQQGVGSWTASADVQHSGEDKALTTSGSVNYTANRARVSLSHSVSNDLAKNGLSVAEAEHRTTLRVGTALAFAGGKVAVGRPISGGFAIVSPHASLEGSPVTIGTDKNIIARSGPLGPALVPNVSTYSMTRLPYDVEDMPIGYDLGTGAFDLRAPYKAGYNLTVGSDYTVSAYGKLIDEYGEPLPLIAGTAYENGNKNGRQVTVFTNRVGRFGAQGLAPGKWVLEMDSAPARRYVIKVPANTTGLYKTGTLKPVR